MADGTASCREQLGFSTFVYGTLKIFQVASHIATLATGNFFTTRKIHQHGLLNSSMAFMTDEVVNG